MTDVKHLVHGAVLAQKQSGEDLVDVINTDSFRRMPIEQKVDFLHEYAHQKAPEPQPLTASQKVKHVLGASAGLGGVGATLGSFHYMATQGNPLSKYTLQDHLGQGDKAVLSKLEAETDRFLNHVKKPALGAAAVGALLGYAHMRDREKDKEYLRRSLQNIRDNKDSHANAAAILFNKEQLNKRRSEGFSNEGFNSQFKTLKDTMFPFGVK